MRRVRDSRTQVRSPMCVVRLKAVEVNKVGLLRRVLDKPAPPEAQHRIELIAAHRCPTCGHRLGRSGASPTCEILRRACVCLLLRSGGLRQRHQLPASVHATGLRDVRFHSRPWPHTRVFLLPTHPVGRAAVLHANFESFRTALAYAPVQAFPSWPSNGFRLLVSSPYRSSAMWTTALRKAVLSAA